MKIRNHKIFSLIVIFTFVASASFAQIPNDYYTDTEGKSGAELKTALYNIIKNPKFWDKYHDGKGKYYGAAGFFELADRTENGYIWDMYSNMRLTAWIGTGTNALNREHCLPKSWFGVASGDEDKASIGCDYHNLYPSNATANSKKGNLPLGEVSNATFDNGVVKVGNNIYAGYTGKVFEPADEYKGDFARTYLYMVTCYEDYANRWTSTGTASMLENNTYPTLKIYAVNLLLAWCAADPVSQKEIDRNNAVFQSQGNRNPFIDHPEFINYIWGNSTPPPSKTLENEYKFNTAINWNNKTLTLLLENTDNLEYEIYDFIGTKVQDNHQVAIQNREIKVEELPAGYYIITVYTKEPFTKKISKF